MDFAAQLADLQRKAEAARRRPADRNDRNSDRTDDRPRQRQRRHNDNDGIDAVTTSATHRNNNNNNNNKPVPFQSLLAAGYRIDPRIASVKQQHNTRVRHICLLAVTIDELPYEDLWKSWANTNNNSSGTTTSSDDPTIVSLVCHAKHPQNIQSEFVKQRLLQEPPRAGRGNQLAPPEFRSHRPEWGSIEILRAMLDILHDGLQIGLETSNTDERYHPKRYLIAPCNTSTDATAKNGEDIDKSAVKIPPADMFVFISETCIPVHPLSHWIRALDASCSWLNARHRTMPGTPRNKYELDQFEGMRLVPGECRWKADQWMALCRSHAIAVREIDNHLPERDRLWRRGFHLVNASDEMYFPTALAVLQLLKPENNDEQQQPSSSSTNDATTAGTVKKRPVTYTDWSQGMKNPTSFTNKDLPTVVEKARAQGSLIARKFIDEISLTDWERLCNTAEQSNGTE
jgi:Core-2/I-Branching enzyme